MTTESGKDKPKCKVCNGDKKVVVGEDDLVPCLFCMGTGEEDWENKDSLSVQKRVAAQKEEGNG